MKLSGRPVVSRAHPVSPLLIPCVNRALVSVVGSVLVSVLVSVLGSVLVSVLPQLVDFHRNLLTHAPLHIDGAFRDGRRQSVKVFLWDSNN